MLPTHRIPTHPGEILLEEFLVPLKISQVFFAKCLDISVQRLNEIVNGKRGITTDTAWKLAGALKTSPEFWMNLQVQHDLAKDRPERASARFRRRKLSPRSAARALDHVVSAHGEVLKKLASR